MMPVPASRPPLMASGELLEMLPLLSAVTPEDCVYPPLRLSVPSFSFTVPPFMTGALMLALATLIVAPASLTTLELEPVRIEALLMLRLEWLSRVVKTPSCMTLPEFRVPGPKFASELPGTASVPLTVYPAFALAPLVALMLEDPDDVKRPLMVKFPTLPRVAPFKVRALRNRELRATLSEVGAVPEALERTKLLAAVKLLTDCWLFASVTVVPANGVSMHTSLIGPGTTPVLQFFAFVQSPSPAVPVHEIVGTGLVHADVLVTVMVAVLVALPGVGLVSI